ncbi:hypothetical protein J4Q44_G00203590 [Coregonus suidteri]|uniref:Anaphase-promoting complex subunit 4 C-terminal half WD40 domain-containing protein n=1 Tax=Coregonus suidteri TaxID=861788 RepID=A0AAN8LV86_9TELE
MVSAFSPAPISLWYCSAIRLDQQSGAILAQGLVLENQWSDFENMKAQFVAVSGIRKVAYVLSSNLRH